MKQSSSSFSIISLIIVSCFCQGSLCQQPYLNNSQLNCYRSSSISRGYVCNSVVNSCASFVTFKSTPNYNTSDTIAALLDSTAADIAWLNRFASTDYQIPHGSRVAVPISCRCWGSIFQHNSRHLVKASETYFGIANSTYQGLTTCQAMSGQNFYEDVDLPAGEEVMVPVRCACPTGKQTVDGVISLVVYMVQRGDTIHSVAKAFGAGIDRLLEANELVENSTIFPFTPLLVPLDSDCCQVNPRFYFCSQSCDSDNTRLRSDCTSSVLEVTLIGVGSGIALLIFVLVVYKLYQWLRRRRQKLNKKKFFKQNGGVLLQVKLKERGVKAKIFTAEELERATDNYNQSRFLGEGGYGTVYKGMLQDGVIVAVKRSKQMEKTSIEQFINEVLILSEINHRNIVKLLGCCLETEFPLLVYEFVPNGKLSDHIQMKNQNDSPSLSWESRLRIACEVAGAIAYMHSAASIPIFHRDIKSSNILLDDNFSAKVSDFGTSRFVPFDQSHLTTNVQGTLGYIDPEYFRSGKFTDRSDVYSFGVLLVELLTGKQPFSYAKDGGSNLLEHFISLDMKNKLVELLDMEVAREENTYMVLSTAKLATRCLRLNGKKRPTMKQAFFELERLRRPQDHSLEIVEEFQTSLIFSMRTTSSSDEDDQPEDDSFSV